MATEPAPGAPGPEDPAALVLAVVRELVAQSQPELAARGRIALDSRLERDLALDSLARVELALRIERAIGARLPQNAAAEAETPADFVAAIARALPAAPGRAPVERAPRAAEAVEGRPDEAATLIDVLEWYAERYPGRRHVTFLVDEEATETLTYGELRTRARRVAAALQRAGLVPRESVAIMLPSGLEFFAVYYGILIAGGVPVPIYPPFRMATVEDHLRRQAGILANAQAQLLVTVPEAKLIARFLHADVPTLRDVLTARELERETAEPVPYAASPQDIAFLQYTSGSTGSPKGVILTHANLLANLRAMGRAAEAGPDDVFLSWLPLYHDMGLIGAWMGSLYFTVHLVLMSPLAFLSRPSRWMREIHRWRATICAAPNFAYELLASRVDAAELEGLDLSSVRWAFNGAEPVSADTLERFAARFARHGLDPRAIAPVYGLAECALDLAFPPSRRGALVDHIDREALAHTGRAVPVAPGSPNAMKVVANGRALPGYEIRIADRAGRTLAERTEGRIEFRGPSATAGYYRNPEATRALFDGDWLDTGDLGYLAEGELYVTGRAKDVIIRGGHNIYPYELEEAVGKLPGIRRGCVAVFGAKSGDGATERVVVLAETRATDPAERERLRAAVNNLAVDLIGGPADEVVLAPPHAVLKTSSGKIRRAATREAWEQGLVGRPAAAAWAQIARLALRGTVARARHALGAAVRFAYGLWAWAMFGLAFVAGFAGVFAIPGVARRQRLAHRLARALAAALGVRITVEGLERLPGGPFTLVANHASYIDPFVLIAAIPREIAFVAKGELATHWLLGPALARAGTRFVERFDVERSVEDARALAAAAGAGQSLVFFPEGTLRRAPGLLAFRTGAFLVAAANGLPVVPATLVGTRALLPDRTWMPRPGPLRVVLDAPLVPRGEGWDEAIRLRNAARAAILARCGEPDAAAEVAPVFAAAR
ncbi:MAG: AMP-binding protein [Burkholderiales bacterium]|nr:AMP-binding protein [Burkholderiales bacterium]